MRLLKWDGMLSMVAGFAFLASGCGPARDKEGATRPEDKKAQAKNPGGDHSGWWCDEHGIPEKECSKCQPDVAEKVKKAGDWCAKHQIAKSQCFKCNQKLFEELFAPRYRAMNNGEDPPKPTDNWPEDGDNK